MENPNVPPTLQLRDDERKKVDEFARQRMRTIRIIMLSTMGGIGLLFMILGIILYLAGVRDPDTGVMPSIVFVPLGAFFLLLGVILFRFLPRSTDSDTLMHRAMANVDATPADMQVLLRLYAKRIGELEARVDALETEIRNSYPRD